MNTKRIISLVASLALVLSLSVGLTGCGDKAAQDDNQGSTDGESTKYTVGICQLVQHEALDAATQGFIDALNEALPGQVEFQNKNASGDSANCSTIVNGFVSDGVDLILANATGALTAAAAATSDIPILGTSITEAIANVLVPAGVPAICGEEGICKGCGVATLSISYYDLGVTTGKMAAKILTGEASVSEMPIEFTEATPKYNASMCETLGITPLDGYTAIEE